jgi:hypothetical protein
VILTVFRGLVNPFAKLAAFITCLAFIANPFAQQVVQTVNCQRSSPFSKGSLSRTTHYAAYTSHTGAGTEPIDPVIGFAINLGFYNPPADASSLISTECKSGNCTFPLFQTLSICGSCDDLSSNLWYKEFNFTLVDPSTNKTLVDSRVAELMRTRAMDDDTCSASIDSMFSFWVVSRPSLISVKGNNHLRPLHPFRVPPLLCGGQLEVHLIADYSHACKRIILPSSTMFSMRNCSTPFLCN